MKLLLSAESLQILSLIKSEAKTLCKSMDDGLLDVIMDSIDRFIDADTAATTDSEAATTDFVAPQSPMNAAAVPLLHAPDDEGAEGTDHSAHLEIDFFSEDIVRAPPAPVKELQEEEDKSGLLAKFQLLCGHIESERVREVYKEMIRLEAKRLELRTLEAWVEERDGAPPHDFSMRWVVVKGAHFLWSNKKLMVTDTRDEDERSRWNECVHLMMISGVSA